MLLELHIQNYALIDSLSLDFAPSLNVLTGETGAGKSILIDALRLALGDRMESGQIRDTSKSCIIQAVFALDPQTRQRDARFAEYAPQADDCLVFKRELTAEGRSKSYLNGQFVNLSVLRELGAKLIHIHSQYDHQQILDSSFHGAMLDRYARAGAKGERFMKTEERYQGIYQRYRELVDSRLQIERDQAQKERELDLLRFQVEEIGSELPEHEEYLRLSEEKIRLAHSERLAELTGTVLSGLDEADDSASSRIAGAFRALTDWSRVDPSAEELYKKLEAAQEQLTELIRQIQDYRDKLVFDDDRLRQIETRMDHLERLLKKYGDPSRPQSMEPVLDFYKKAKERLDYLEGSETLSKDMDREIAALKPSLQKEAAILGELRQEAGSELSKTLMKELGELGIRQARFVCELRPCDFSSSGTQTVEFMLSANPGQPLAPLGAVASGGEAARMMLALKKTLAHADSIGALIFDEIDANIGGRLGAVVGEKIKAISRHRQVLLITHLPQIASFADRHIQVVKKTTGKQTRVDYRVLEGEERVRELAQMMSGDEETHISKTHAEEMLRAAANKKA